MNRSPFSLVGAIGPSKVGDTKGTLMQQFPLV